MVLDDVISEMEKELREAGNALWRVTLEWRRIEARERRDTDAAGGGATWKAASGVQSSKAEIGPAGESGVGVNRKSSLEEQSYTSSAGGSQKKWRAAGTERIYETQE